MTSCTARLQAFAAGLGTRHAAIRAAGVRDDRDILLALGEAGLMAAWSPEHEIGNQAGPFVRIRSSS